MIEVTFITASLALSLAVGAAVAIGFLSHQLRQLEKRMLVMRIAWKLTKIKLRKIPTLRDDLDKLDEILSDFMKAAGVPTDEEGSPQVPPTRNGERTIPAGPIGG